MTTVGTKSFFDENNRCESDLFLDMDNLNREELIELYNDIEYLSENIDPFSSSAPPKKIKKLLSKYNLIGLTKNPYSLTNALLQCLSLIEIKLKQSNS